MKYTHYNCLHNKQYECDIVVVDGEIKTFKDNVEEHSWNTRDKVYDYISAQLKKVNSWNSHSLSSDYDFVKEELNDYINNELQTIQEMRFALELNEIINTPKLKLNLNLIENMNEKEIQELTEDLNDEELYKLKEYQKILNEKMNIIDKAIETRKGD